MGGERAEKARFVEGPLRTMLIAATAHDVIGARYEAGGEDGEERVVVVHMNGYKRSVRVTGDSLVSIAADVLKEL